MNTTESTIQFERVYRGKITAIQLLYTSAWGMRSYKVYFGSYIAYFEFPSKRALPIHINSVARFTAHRMDNGVWMIDEVLDSFPATNAPAPAFGQERQLTAAYRQ